MRYLKVTQSNSSLDVSSKVGESAVHFLKIHLFCWKVWYSRTGFHSLHHILKLVKVLFILKVHLFIEKECRRTGFQVRDSTGRHASRKFSLKGPEGKFKFSCRSFQFVYK